MKAIYGLYSSGGLAQQAVNRLKAAGVAERDIVVMSAQPMEDFEFGRSDSKNYELGAITDGRKKFGGHTRLKKPISVSRSKSYAEIRLGQKSVHGGGT